MAGRIMGKVACGATTRRGTPCQRKVWPGKRCINHGGLSTGPKTTEGKFRSAMNLPRVRQAYRRKSKELLEKIEAKR
jgi:hypothetical protein